MDKLGEVTKLKVLFAAILLASLGVNTVFAGELEISSVIEVEASFVQNAGFVNGENSSDVALATVEVGLDKAINDQVDAHVLFLFEENSTPFDIDEGTISVQLSDVMSLTAGKAYVPFGNYSSNMISDPLTLALGETNETMIQLSFESNGVSGSVYVFNGDSIKTGEDDSIAGVGANIDFAGAIAEGELNLGASIISNIADSDTVQGLGTSAEVTDTIAGIGVYATWGRDLISVIAEYVQANDDFIVGDLGLVPDGGTSNVVTAASAPTAANIEFAYDMGNGANVALAYQKTTEAEFIGLPEDGVSLTIATDSIEGVNLAFEYATLNEYGTGNSSSTIVFQVASEF